ncbi:MAG: ParA family protein [Magnetococcales bacterium]|nr:ParA family protein [Magnetococcales bacterium]
MTTYAFWNNKSGVGKSYLTFQVASEYAKTHSNQPVLVIDLCPQANASSMLLGGMGPGDQNLDQLCNQAPRKTISGYMESRILSPYINPATGGTFLIQASQYNKNIPENLFLLPGDEQLEMQSSRVLNAAAPGPTDAWRMVHIWISDLIEDVKKVWNQKNITVFIDCNPSFSIYTELALSASDGLIIPFSADGSSKRAVRAVLALLYGITRVPGNQQSPFYLHSQQSRLQIPKIYFYVGNRLTQFKQSAQAFRTVVREIGNEIWSVWQNNPNVFFVHPPGQGSPATRSAFNHMFQFEINDANTASVVSSSLGIPLTTLAAGKHVIPGAATPSIVNQSQLDKLQPNIRDFVTSIMP